MKDTKESLRQEILELLNKEAILGFILINILATFGVTITNDIASDRAIKSANADIKKGFANNHGKIHGEDESFYEKLNLNTVSLKYLQEALESKKKSMLATTKLIEKLCKTAYEDTTKNRGFNR